jgi:O-6-methylguanine DNA methyltransferase
MDFKTAVHKVVREIPEGKTLTYKEVALLSGHPGAFRAVGTLLAQNYDPTIPCHRVIRSDGKLGNYNRGAELKREILKNEGAVQV